MTEVAIYQPTSAELATTPPPSGPLDSWIVVADQVVRLAEKICSSPFVPDGLRGSVPATAAAILAGRELGIPPMTALANVHVIKGKTGISALLMRALIQAQGHDWEDVEVTDTRAVVRGRRRGETEWTTATFTADQAKRAQIQLGGYPQDKLYARATSRLARRKFADVIAGMPYSAEELEDEPEGLMLPDSPGYAADRAAERAAAEPAKPRTAQRRQRQQPAERPTAPASGAPSRPARSSAPATAAGSDLPPLPGEDEPDPAPARQPDTAPEPSGSAPDERDYDSPFTATPAQIGKIQTVYNSVFAFKRNEHAQLVPTTEKLLSAELGTQQGRKTHNSLSFNQARALIDVLAEIESLERREDETPRDSLVAFLASLSPAGPQDQADGEAADA